MSRPLSIQNSPNFIRGLGRQVNAMVVKRHNIVLFPPNILNYNKEFSMIWTYSSIERQ